MITVNALIADAFRKCSLTMDGGTPTGNQAVAGLSDLKSVIAELNGQNLILTDVEVADITNSGKIKVMSELPEGWSESATLPIDGMKAGDICKAGNKVYAYDLKDNELQWIERTDIEWPDLLINPLIDRVVTLSRKIGNRYTQLYPAERQVLDSRVKGGLPTFYTCETELRTVKAANQEYNFEMFIIETDSYQSVDYRITYLKTIPSYNLYDKLYFSEKILSIIEDGLCAKLCLRYKLLDTKQFFDTEYGNGVRLLKRTNINNRPMTYEGLGGSYLDNFYNGFSPREW